METVLVVEDDRVYARTTTNWLVKNGINARYVLSVDSAKVFLEGHKVDLLLSDFRLNDSNGVELLEWMKAQGYRMPFLIMTGYGDIPGAVEAVKRGAADYLPKPIQTEKVLGIIRGRISSTARHMCHHNPVLSPSSPSCPFPPICFALLASWQGNPPVRISTRFRQILKSVLVISA